jgi:bacterioferritin-associated ferredoxin
VYVCICNALNTRAVKAAITEGGAQRVSGVYAACGCEAQCGKCAGEIADMIAEHSASAGKGTVASLMAAE